jgi:phage shock protein PspC (stress-responsive transcriptional regulator)
MTLQRQAVKELRRSSAGVIGGVCAGLAEYFGISITFTRLVFVMLGLAQGVGLVLYILLLVIMPAAQVSSSIEGNEAGYKPQKSKKTIFAYLSGTVAILAALFGFVDNAMSIIGFLQPNTRQSSMPISVYAPPRSKLPTAIPTVSHPATTLDIRDYPGLVDADHDPNLQLTKVTIDNNSTQITFRYANMSNEPVNLEIYPPGTNRTFYIITLDGLKRFNLTAIAGIKAKPSVNILNPGERLEFKLTFERLDNGIKNFNIVEGDVREADTTYWDFSGIQLNDY